MIDGYYSPLSLKTLFVTILANTKAGKGCTNSPMARGIVNDSLKGDKIDHSLPLMGQMTITDTIINEYN